MMRQVPREWSSACLQTPSTWSTRRGCLPPKRLSGGDIRSATSYWASTVAIVFGTRIRNKLSGYRVFSTRFVKSFPALASGFEMEAEITIHALDLRLPVAEIQTRYRPRVSGSTSELRTFRDGFRILRIILLLIKEESPLQVFSAIAASLATIGLILGWPVVTHYLQTGLVPRFPSAILATGLMVLAFISFVVRLMLDSVWLGRREIKRLDYLGLKGPGFRQPSR